jgi:hypothetical protein
VQAGEEEAWTSAWRSQPLTAALIDQATHIFARQERISRRQMLFLTAAKIVPSRI